MKKDIFNNLYLKRMTGNTFKGKEFAIHVDNICYNTELGVTSTHIYLHINNECQMLNVWQFGGNETKLEGCKYIAGVDINQSFECLDHAINAGIVYFLSTLINK